MIDYVFEENLLTKDKSNDRSAHVVNQHSYTEEDIAAAIAEGNIGISKAEALAALEAEAEIIKKWIAPSCRIANSAADSISICNAKLCHFSCFCTFSPIITQQNYTFSPI